MSSTAVLENAKTPEPEWDSEALYEVVNGVRVEKPMSAYGTEIGLRLYLPLALHVSSHRLGRAQHEMLFILDRKHNLQRRPDVSFVSAERWPLAQPIPRKGDWEVVPDLAVEVISPNDRLLEVKDKLDDYFRCGVRQVWVILPPQQRVEIYESPDRPEVITVEGQLSGGAIIPGFVLPVSSLFED